MTYAIPHPAYALLREPRYCPAGTFPMEHVLTGGPVLVTTALADRGAALDLVELSRLAVGQNVTTLSADFRYSVEREA